MSKRLSLRRTCRGCAHSKRKCDFSWPKCSRCVARGFECFYDNEPLTRANTKLIQRRSINASEIPRDCSRKVSDFVPLNNTDVPEARDLPTMMALAYQPISLWVLLGPSSPEVRLALDEATSDYIWGHLRGFVASFARNGRAPFIHANLYETGTPKQLKDALVACRAHMNIHTSSDQGQQMLFRKSFASSSYDILDQSKKAQSLWELLASTHALMLILIPLLGSGHTERPLADALSNQLLRCTMKMWDGAPPHLPNSLSQRQAWILAESVRRAILSAHMVLGHYAQFKQGYFVHTLFVEALPFDVRSHLWDAPGPYAWHLCTNNESSSALTGYREFTDMWQRGDVQEFGPFETLLLVACKSKEFVERHELLRAADHSSSIWLYL